VSRPDALRHASRRWRLGYHVPPRGTPEHSRWASSTRSCCRLGQPPAPGAGSRGRDTRARWPAASNLLRNMFNVNGPVLWTAYLFHDAATPADAILAALDAEVESLRSAPVEQATLDRALVKARLGALRQPGGHPSASARRPARLLRAVRRRPREGQPPEQEFRKVTRRCCSRRPGVPAADQTATCWTIEPGTAEPAAGRRGVTPCAR